MLSWLDISLPEASENLRLDEELLAEGRGVLRLWESTRECVILGRSGVPDRDVHLAECERSGIPVFRRCSGGGAVLLGPGCINYSLIFPLEGNPQWRDVRQSLRSFLSRIQGGLAVPGLRFEGTCDLALRNRKVSGSAQHRTNRAILHHGTLLYDFDASRAERFLKPPAREPRYRAGRTHRDFLGNLPLTADEIRRRMVRAWC
jgi:lipoate-protein ligase A